MRECELFLGGDRAGGDKSDDRIAPDAAREAGADRDEFAFTAPIAHALGRDRQIGRDLGHAQ